VVAGVAGQEVAYDFGFNIYNLVNDSKSVTNRTLLYFGV